MVNFGGKSCGWHLCFRVVAPPLFLAIRSIHATFKPHIPAQKCGGKRKVWLGTSVKSPFYSIYGGFLKCWYPQNTPKWSFLVGKPMVVGYHHFRKHPYVCLVVLFEEIQVQHDATWSNMQLSPRDWSVSSTERSDLDMVTARSTRFEPKDQVQQLQKAVSHYQGNKMELPFWGSRGWKFAMEYLQKMFISSLRCFNDTCNFTTSGKKNKIM